MSDYKLTPAQQKLVHEMRTTGAFIRDFLGQKTLYSGFRETPIRDIRDSVFDGLQKANLLKRSRMRNLGYAEAYVLNREAL